MIIWYILWSFWYIFHYKIWQPWSQSSERGLSLVMAAIKVGGNFFRSVESQQSSNSSPLWARCWKFRVTGLSRFCLFGNFLLWSLLTIIRFGTLFVTFTYVSIFTRKILVWILVDFFSQSHLAGLVETDSVICWYRSIVARFGEISPFWGKIIFPTYSNKKWFYYSSPP
jgi:hypothetical protein